MCAQLPPRAFRKTWVTCAEGAAYRLDTWHAPDAETHHAVDSSAACLPAPMAADTAGMGYVEVDGRYVCHAMPRAVRLLPAALARRSEEDVLNAALSLGSADLALLYDGALYTRALTRAQRGDTDVHLLDAPLAALLRAAISEDLGGGFERTENGRECHAWLRDGDDVTLTKGSGPIRLLLLVRVCGDDHYVEVVARPHPQSGAASAELFAIAGQAAPLAASARGSACVPLVTAFQLVNTHGAPSACSCSAQTTAWRCVSYPSSARVMSLLCAAISRLAARCAPVRFWGPSVLGVTLVLTRSSRWIAKEENTPRLLLT